MTRRNFIGLLGGAAAAWPLAARAQQPARVPRIGFLFYGAPELSLEIDAFRQGLRELGYIEGQNILVEYRFAGGQVGKLPELAAELVRLKVEVIVTPTTPASMAAKQATSTIPIVIAAVADAVGRLNQRGRGRAPVVLRRHDARQGAALFPVCQAPPALWACARKSTVALSGGHRRAAQSL